MITEKENIPNMKKFKLTNSLFLLLLFAGLFLTSCNKNEDPNIPSYKYLFTDDYKFDITSQQAIANFSTGSIDPTLLSYVITSDVEVHSLTYKTTFKDQNIQASGLVCLPKTAGNYPVLSFQNGTNTEHSKAPSVNPEDDLFSIMESVAAMGFIVVMPDYIGFGASAEYPHPYLHAKSTTQSILDMLRAVQEFGTEDKIVAKPTKDLFLFGYSQGGWATMQLQKTIETDYSSEFNLKASSCGAGPYSLSYINKYITESEEYPMPYFLTYLLHAYIAVGEITNPISDFIQEPYAAKIADLYDGEHTGGSINMELTTKMADLLTPEYRTEWDTNPKFTGLKTALLANSITAWNVSTPTRLYHGADDEFIPVGMSYQMMADFKTAGASDSVIEMIPPIEGKDHKSAVVPVGIETILWFLQMKNGL